MPAIRTTPSVRWLLIISVGAYLLQLVGDNFLQTHIMATAALVPYAFLKQHYYWQLVTYMFMHADMFHILFNMLMLWMFGSELEAQWGVKFFVKYYFTCGISAGLFYIAMQALLHGTSSATPIVGSSGAIYGLLVAYGILYSERQILFMMIFPMKTKHMVMILAAIEFVSTVFNSGAGLANAVHLFGMLVGFVYLFANAWWRIRAKRGKQGRRGRLRRTHLRLVVNNEVLREFDDDEDEDDEGSSGGPGRPTFH